VFIPGTSVEGAVQVYGDFAPPTVASLQFAPPFALYSTPGFPAAFATVPLKVTATVGTFAPAAGEAITGNGKV